MSRRAPSTFDFPGLRTGLALAAVCATSGSTLHAQACTTTRVSVATGGAESFGNWHEFSEISADGRYVVFASSCSDLVTGDTNGTTDIFRHDRLTTTTIRVSVASNGDQANSLSEIAHLSDDGRFVAFNSRASNLAPGDTNNMSDIFWHDCVTGETRRVSVGNGGAQSVADVFDCAISGDGRFVAFPTVMAFDPIDTNGTIDIYVHDTATSTTSLASLTSSGGIANNTSLEPALSGDGRYVAFKSRANNLGPVDTNGFEDVYVKDRLTGAVTLASVTPSGNSGDSTSAKPSISADGRFVAFESAATNLTPVTTPYASRDVFVRDLVNGTTTLASVTLSGQQVANEAHDPDISADGRYVVFSSGAPDLVIGDTNNVEDIFLRDLQLGVTVRMNLRQDGEQADALAVLPSVSGDGTLVAFDSPSAILVPGDTNANWDVFVRQCPAPSGTIYCAGDGTATACPCGNFGVTGSGCANPVQPQGGHVFALGTASVANDTLLLRGEAMSNSIVTYFQGTTQTNGGAGIVYGDGLLCVGGAIIRLGLEQNVAGASYYPGAGNDPISIRGAIPPGGGVTRFYQVWYRSAAPFCTPATFNLTNGVRIVWGS